MAKPLSDIKVIELADYVSAPVGARFLADMGAEVIKIERPTGNTWRGNGKNDGVGVYSDAANPSYDINNMGKKHIVLNLKTPEGKAVCMKMLETADVFVTNMRVQALERLGLDYESLKDRFPRLIYAIGLGFGLKGPDANRPALDHTAFWARTGFLQDMAPLSSDYHPVFPPSSLGDNFTGMTLATEICAALFNREKTGKGDYVRSCLFHCGIFATGAMQLRAQGNRPNYPISRPRHGVDYGDYLCADGLRVFIASGFSEAVLGKMFPAAGAENLLLDPRFSTWTKRHENAEELYEAMSKIMLTKTADEWLQLSLESDVPMTKMRHFGEIEHDEQAIANGYIDYITYKTGQTFFMPTSPIEMDSVGTPALNATKAVGEDTVSVLREYGYTDEELSALKENGVI